MAYSLSVGLPHLVTNTSDKAFSPVNPKGNFRYLAAGGTALAGVGALVGLVLLALHPAGHTVGMIACGAAAMVCGADLVAGTILQNYLNKRQKQKEDEGAESEATSSQNIDDEIDKSTNDKPKVENGENEDELYDGTNANSNSENDIKDADDDSNKKTKSKTELLIEDDADVHNDSKKDAVSGDESDDSIEVSAYNSDDDYYDSNDKFDDVPEEIARDDKKDD
jgi:hypothetical protein